MTYLPAVMGLSVIHAIFVASEYAFVRAAQADHTSLAHAIRENTEEDIFENLEVYLQVCQIGKTICLLILGVGLGFELNQRVFGANEMMKLEEITSLAITLFSVVLVQTILGFELPKMIAIKKYAFCVRWLSGFLRVCKYLLTPIILPIIQVRRLILVR